MKNDYDIHVLTGLHIDEFDYLLNLFCEEAQECNYLPLFRDNGPRDSDPGNRCSLYLRHALLLALRYKWSRQPQKRLATSFGIDQSSVSRYIKLCDKILKDILPTAKTVSGTIATCRSIKEVKKYIPGPKGRGDSFGWNADAT